MTTVRTVLGPIDASRLGFTAAHEHIAWGMDGWQLAEAWWRPDRDILENAVRKLLDFKATGGDAIVEVTGIGFGRNVSLMQEASRRSGVHIVPATGFWAGFGVAPYFRTKEVGFLADLFVRELTEGIVGSTVLAGVIKVGNDHVPGVYAHHGSPGFTTFERNMFAAAAQASIATGASITTHGISRGYEQASLLASLGVDPGRVVIGHADAKYALDFDRDVTLAKEGFTIAYDHVGMEPWSPRPYALLDEERADLVANLVDAGFENNLVVSCDQTCCAIGRPTPLSQVSRLTRSFVPMLRDRGIPEDTIDNIFRRNPARLFGFPEPGGTTA